MYDLNQAAWTEWEEWRRLEKRKKITKRAEGMQQKMLREYPEEIQRQIIESSMMNDYQGLFRPKHRPKVATTRQTTLYEDLTDTSWAH